MKYPTWEKLEDKITELEDRIKQLEKKSRLKQRD